MRALDEHYVRTRIERTLNVRFFSKNYRPAKDDGLFAWAFIPSTIVCQIAPHYFGFERFLGWPVQSNAIWVMLAGFVALVFSLSVCGLVGAVMWFADRRDNSRNATHAATHQAETSDADQKDKTDH